MRQYSFEGQSANHTKEIYCIRFTYTLMADILMIYVHFNVFNISGLDKETHTM